MKRNKAPHFFLALSLFLLFPLAGCGFNASEMSSLRDISRPYVGEYKCRKLLFGGRDMIEKFDYVKLNLGYGGDFRLFCAENGKEGEYRGRYEIDEEANTLTLHAEAGGEEQRYVFPYVHGIIEMELIAGGKLLYAEFIGGT